MLKAEFRFFLVDFVPFLNFRIGVGHVAVTIKKHSELLLSWYLFCRLKSFFKTGASGNPALDSIPILGATASRTSRTMPQTAFLRSGPHSFLLKNSSLCLLGTATIYCDSYAPCHAHSKGHSKPLSDLAWETPSHSRRSFSNLKRILFGELNDFVW